MVEDIGKGMGEGSDLPEGYQPPEPTHPGYAYRTPGELAAEQRGDAPDDSRGDSEADEADGWVPSEPPDPDA